MYESGLGSRESKMGKRRDAAHEELFPAIEVKRMGNIIVPHVMSPKYIREDSDDPEIGRKNLLKSRM